MIKYLELNNKGLLTYFLFKNKLLIYDNFKGNLDVLQLTKEELKDLVSDVKETKETIFRNEEELKRWLSNFKITIINNLKEVIEKDINYLLLYESNFKIYRVNNKIYLVIFKFLNETLELYFKIYFFKNKVIIKTEMDRNINKKINNLEEVKSDENNVLKWVLNKKIKEVIK